MNSYRTNDISFSGLTFKHYSRDEVIQIMEAYASIFNKSLRDLSITSIWHDDVWFNVDNPDHEFMFDYLVAQGFAYKYFLDSDGDKRKCIKYIRLESESIKPINQLIGDTSWEQLARWKQLNKTNQTLISQPKNKSFISTLSSWLTSEKLFGNMNAALLFALKTWRQQRKRPWNLIAMVIPIAFVLVIVLTQVI